MTQAMAVKANDEWDYKPLRYRFQAHAYGFCSTALYLATAYLTLPSAGFSALLSYGVALATMNVVMDSGNKSTSDTPFMQRSADLVRVGSGDILNNMRQMETALDMPPTKGLHVLRSKRFVRRVCDYGGNRSMARMIGGLILDGLKGPAWNDARAEKLYNKNATRLYLAYSRDRSVITTKQALLNSTFAQNNFVIAHELIHIKNQDGQTKVATAHQSLTREMSGLTVWLAPFVANSPLAAVALIVAGIVVHASHKKISRIAETLADRGAIYLTRDFEAASGFLSTFKFSENKRSILPTKLAAIFHTHPVDENRINGLRKAFAEASRYPALQGDFVRPDPEAVTVFTTRGSGAARFNR